MSENDLRTILGELQDLIDDCMQETNQPVNYSMNAIARRNFYRRYFGELLLELELEEIKPGLEVLVFKQANGFWGSEYTVVTCGLSEAASIWGIELMLRFDDASLPSGSFEDSTQFRYLERAISYLVDNPCEAYQVFALDGVEFPEREDGLYTHAITIPTRHELDEVRIGIAGRPAVSIFDVEFLTENEVVHAEANGVHNLLQMMREFDHSHYFTLFRQDYAGLHNVDV